MNRTVIFIYGADGLEHNLLEKINNYLPIQVREPTKGQHFPDKNSYYSVYVFSDQ